MKSGPTLKAWTVRPRRRQASRSPSVTVVLPTPLPVPAMTNTFAISADPCRLERRHLGIETGGRPGQVHEQGAARAFAQPQRQLQIRTQAQVLQHARVTGL